MVHSRDLNKETGCIEMPYYPNGTIDKWMAAKKPSDDQKIVIFRQGISFWLSK